MLWTIAMVARANDVVTCISVAETHNTGLSVSVKLGTTTVLTTADLDAAFDEIAEHYDDATLNVMYNTAGRAAIRQAMDCTFDNGWVTLSTAWVNKNVSDLAVRTYGVLAVDSSNQPLWTAELDSVDPEGSYTVLHFNASGGECVAVYATARGSYDFESEFTSSVKAPASCASEDCSKCKRENSNTCSCKSGDGSCSYGPIVSDVANGAIIVVTL